jgi:trans-aconitate methyltransferase
LPSRIEWALELLDVAPADQVLEFGCGPGVAASSVADRLVNGCITAIDRSPTGIARARARNAHHLTSGRLVLEEVALANFRSEKRFDKAFGVNVNLFWTKSADVECQVLRGVLAPRGVVHLVYDGPGDRGYDVGDEVAATLSRKGFTATVRRGANPSLVCVTSLPAR